MRAVWETRFSENRDEIEGQYFNENSIGRLSKCVIE
jgi:hypothetical protein